MTDTNSNLSPEEIRAEELYSQICKVPLDAFFAALSKVTSIPLIVSGKDEELHQVYQREMGSEYSEYCYYKQDSETVFDANNKEVEYTRLDVLCHYFNQLYEYDWSDEKMMETILDVLKWKFELKTVKKIIPKAFTMGEFYSLDIPKVGYLVEGLVTDIGINFLVGSPGAGKSFFSFELAKCVSRGEKLFGKFSTKQTNVLIVELDDYEGVSRERMQLLGINSNDSIIVWDKKARFFLKGDEDECDYLINFLLENKIGLLIIDCFRIIHRATENSSDEMTPVLESLKQICQEVKCSILPLHHERKENEFLGRKADRIRGSNAIEAAAMTILSLKQKSREKAISVSQVRNKNINDGR